MAGLFEEPNIKTLNHKFKKTKDGYTSRQATKEEIKKARINSKKGEWMVIGRSCWECNIAHNYLIDKPNINCYVCGRYYHYGIDITDYKGSDFEKYTYLIKKTNK